MPIIINGRPTELTLRDKPTALSPFRTSGSMTRDPIHAMFPRAGGDAVPTRAASLDVVVPASMAAPDGVLGGGPIVVFGGPKASNGTQGTCPGKYAGYINYTKTISQGWGWVPSTNTTTFTASDGGGRTDTTITYMGISYDSGCNQTSVTIPNPPYSPSYRFTIYFPKNVPTTNYPIVLTGFNP